jgi:hypothetical protein
MKRLLLAGVAAVTIVGSGSAMAAFQGFAHNPLGPEFLITFTDSGVMTALNPVYTTDPGPYDGNEDTYFGVVNNSSKTISSFNVASTVGAQIAGFDNDGIDEAAYLNIPHNANDPTGYGGPNAFFTGISVGLDALTVNFAPGIAAGGTDVFSLEEPIALNTIVIGTPEPSTWAMMLIGFAGLAFAGYRKSKSNRLALTV